MKFNLLKLRESRYLLEGKLLVILFLILYPVFFYSYLFISGDIKTISFLGLTFTSLYFQSIQTFVWTLVGKLLPFLAFSAWYLSDKKKWINVLHVPIAMYLFQIIRLLQQDIFRIDTFEFFFTIPFILFYSFLLYYYRQYLKKEKQKFEYQKRLVKLGSEVLIKKNEKEGKEDK